MLPGEIKAEFSKLAGQRRALRLNLASLETQPELSFVQPVEQYRTKKRLECKLLAVERKLDNIVAEAARSRVAIFDGTELAKDQEAGLEPVDF